MTEPEPQSSDTHPCLLVVERDYMAYLEQYVIGCRCHGGNRRVIWRPGDPQWKCDGIVRW